MKPLDVPSKPDFKEPPRDTSPAAELKRMAKPFAYNEHAREPHLFIGTPIAVFGTVMQAVSDGDSVMLLVRAERGGTVYVNYQRSSPAERRILEGDPVSIWGRFEGIKTYTAVRGDTKQVPHVTAALLEYGFPTTGPAVIRGPGYHRRGPITSTR